MTLRLDPEVEFAEVPRAGDVASWPQATHAARLHRLMETMP